MASTSPLASTGMDAQTLNAMRPTKSFNVNNPKDLAALKKVGPLAQHPAYTSAWRREAAREQVDNGMRK